MPNSDEATASSPNHFQYAVPVTIASFSKGFVAHNYWAPRHWIPQIRTFYRAALYTIESPHSSSRQIRRRLPTEIIDIIAQYVKEAAVAQGFLDCEQRMGVFRTDASLEIEKGLMLMEKWGRWSRPFVANAEDDTLSKFMMQRYSLSVMPGMKNNIHQFGYMTHLFLCFSSSSEPPQPIKIEDWTTSKHSHPALSDGLVKGAPSTQCTIFPGAIGVSVATIYILEKEFVEKALDGKSAIGRAVREMKLEVVALAQMS